MMAEKRGQAGPNGLKLRVISGGADTGDDHAEGPSSALRAEIRQRYPAPPPDNPDSDVDLLGLNSLGTRDELADIIPLRVGKNEETRRILRELARDAFEKGKKLLEKGRIDEAYKQFQGAEEMGSHKARFYRGLLLMAHLEGAFDEGLVVVCKALHPMLNPEFLLFLRDILEDSLRRGLLEAPDRLEKDGDRSIEHEISHILFEILNAGRKKDRRKLAGDLLSALREYSS